jgi:hypothetical protein
MYSKKFNTIEGVNIPKEKISLYNDKIFKLCLNKDFSQITQEEMYNCFSEKGGNHNLIISVVRVQSHNVSPLVANLPSPPHLLIRSNQACCATS